MFNKFKWKTTDFFAKVKRSVSENKYVYIAVIVAVISGAIFGIGRATRCEDPSNIIIKIADKEFSYALFYIKLILFCVATYFCGWLLGFNRIAFMFNLLLILIVAMSVTKIAVVACMASISGIILLLLYLPLLVINIWLFTEFLISIYAIQFPCAKWTDIVSLSFTRAQVLKRIKKFLAAALLFDIAYSAVFLVIVSCVF